MKKQSTLFSILQAGFLVGTLDILAAFIQYYIRTGKSPEPVLKFIASGVFGSSAFTSGNGMLAWGLLFHYGIAFIFTIIFFVLIKIFPEVLHQRIFTGILYGLFVWAVMRFVVVPLSHTPAIKSNITNIITAILILIVCIGLPLSFLAKKNK